MAGKEKKASMNCVLPGYAVLLNFLKIGTIFFASSGDEKVNIQNTLFASFPVTANRVAT